jgi:acyl carrier protein phosphodiesterase
LNFLGHIYFSGSIPEYQVYNLFGDFVKGNKFLHYSPQIQESILLHRKIDSFVDTHPVVYELKMKLFSHLPKVAGIAIDIYFDHILAKNWNQFSSVTLNDYLKRLYEYVNRNDFSYLSEEFEIFIKRLAKYDWISYYPSLDGLNKACQGVSRRISFDNELKNGLHVFLMCEKEIEQTFWEYMKDASLMFNQKY